MPFNKNEILKERERKRARQTAGQRETHTQRQREIEFLKKGHGTDRQTLRGV